MTLFFNSLHVHAMCTHVGVHLNNSKSSSFACLIKSQVLMIKGTNVALCETLFSVDAAKMHFNMASFLYCSKTISFIH